MSGAGHHRLLDAGQPGAAQPAQVLRVVPLRRRRAQALVDIAQATGMSGYPGDGANRWPAVHVSDAADLLVRAVDRAPAGTVLHATAEEGIATKDIAAAIGGQLGLPVRPVEDPSHFGFLADFFGMDAPASSALTRALLDWQPTGPGLLHELETGIYTYS